MVNAERADTEALRATAGRHLWGHFTTMGTADDSSRIIERGEGCYVWDTEGNRYLDGLSLIHI